MRSLFYIAATLAVIGLAYWAYKENYATQAALKKVEALQSEIASARERAGVLKAEWAYLNRPARLRDLVDLNYDRLRLNPLAPEQFGNIADVAFPKINPRDVTRTVDLSAPETASAPDPLGADALPVKSQSGAKK